MRLWIQLAIGLLLSGIIAYAGYRKRALATSGVAGAMIVGTAIFGLGGWIWGMLLITFFVLSSSLSAYKKSTKQVLAEKFDKGSQRDFWQAFANAGTGALIAAAYPLFPHPALFAAFVGAMATVNADTWATELGVLSRVPPRLITTGKTVEPGTSGGISRLGTLATLAGGLSIGIAALVFVALDTWLGGAANALFAPEQLANAIWLLPIAAVGGLTGAFGDSLLGATLQVIYYSVKREKETEKRIDPDGTPNTYLRGWRWLNNDWVNFISSGIGAATAALLWRLAIR
ncbi:MAG: DUF92 domain-containing protein [Anaerolineae bacterium]|nr:DUF92 domain-containing protein [Anaerolineae bacterium]